MATQGAIQAGQAAIRVIADSSTLHSDLLRASQKLESWGKKVEGIGRKAFVAATAMAIPTAFSVNTFANFEAQISKVGAVTQASAEQMSQLREQAKLLGKTTFFTAQQAAEGQAMLGMAGFNPEQIQAAMPDILNMSLAGDIDLGMAADIATNISMPFEIAAKDMRRITDILAQTANASTTNIEELGEAFKFAASPAHAAGQSIEECAASMAILANTGLKGEMAGTGIRMVLIKLADPKIQETLLGMGVAAKDSTGKIRPILDVMRDLNAATQGMTQADRLSMFFNLFDARGGNIALALANAGSTADDFRAKMAACTNVGQQMASVMTDNLAGDFKGFASAIESVQIALGDTFNGSLRDITKWSTESIRSFSEWIKKNQESVILAAKVAGSVLGIGLACGAASVSLKAAGAAMAFFSSASKALLPAKALFLSIASASRIASSGYENMGVAASKLTSTLGLSARSMGMQKVAAIALASPTESLRLAISSLRGSFANAITAVKALQLSTLRAAAAEKLSAAWTAICATTTKTLAGTKAFLSAATSLATYKQIGLTLAQTAGGVVTKSLAIASLGLSAAIKGIGRAILAIPGWGWALAGVAALGSLAAYAFSASIRTAELSDEAEKARETGDEQRKIHEEQFTRLQKLSEAESLNSQQQKEAKSLITQLKVAYGDLGVSLDETAGKLNIASGAQEKFNAAQRDAALKQLEKEQEEVVANNGSLMQEQGDIMNSGFWSRVMSGKNHDELETRNEEINRTIRENNTKLGAIIRKRQALLAQVNGAATGDGTTGAGIPDLGEITADETTDETAKQREDQLSRLGEIQKNLAKDRRSQIENEIADIQELSAEYQTLLKTLIATEQAKGENGDKNAIAAWQAELANAPAVESARIGKAVEKAVGETPSKAMSDAQWNLDNAMLGGNATAIEAAKKAVEDTKKSEATNELAKARENYKNSVDRFNWLVKNGGSQADIGAARVGVSEAQGKMGAASNNLAGMVGSIQEAAKEARKIDFGVSASSRGTFSAWEAVYGGKNDWQKTASDKIVSILNRIAGNTEDREYV